MRTNGLQASSRALAVAVLLALASSAATAVTSSTKPTPPEPGPKAEQAATPQEAAPKRKLDRSGKKRVGKASYYARKFAGRKMADGTPMKPQGDNAASKTLPLGTRARVTNLETGQSTEVTVRDRGPYVQGRIIDLSPQTARDIGITPHEGVAPVEVAPIEVPLADGGRKPGEGARGSY
jgi:rare lipoprotein A